MAGQQLARDEAGNVWEVDANGQPIKLHSPAPAQRQGGVFNLPPDSLTAQGQSSAIGHTQAETTGVEIKNRVAAQTAPAAVRQAEGEANKAEMQGKGLDPSIRDKALAQWSAAQQLDATIADMRDKFQKGPGATTPWSLSSLGDFASTPTNQQFDKASDAGRGIVRNALGLTGGENNTAGEANMNIGPYSPHASDYDATILDSIGRLEGLRNKARSQAIMTLGGVPDANGVVTPLTEQQKRDYQIGGMTAGPNGPPPRVNMVPPRGPDRSTPISSLRPDAGPGAGPGGTSIEHGSVEHYSTVKDKAYQAALQRAFNGGASRSQLQGLAAKFGYPPLGADLDAALSYRDKGGHGAAINLPESGARQIGMRQQNDNTFADTDFGAGAVHAGLAAGALPNGISRLAGRALGFNGDMRQAFGNQEQNDALTSYLQQGHRKSAFAGSAIGGLAGAGGLEALAAKGMLKLGVNQGARATAAPILGDASFGVLQGAGNAENGGEIQGAAFGGLSGVGGGMMGRQATRALGAAATGVRDPAVQYLAARGVPMSFGQAVSQSGWLGGLVKKTEDATTGILGPGNMVGARRKESIQGFNHAMFNDANPTNTPSVTALAEPGVEQLQGNVGTAYRTALDGRSIPPDFQFGREIAGARARGLGTPTYGGDFGAILNDEIKPIVAGSPAFSGRQFQQLDRTLGGYERQYGKISQGTSSVPPAPMAGRVGNAFGDMSDSLDGLVNRQAPDLMPQYNAAKEAYRKSETIRDAVNRARNGSRSGETGLVMPSQLSDAAASNATKFGGTQGTTNQPFYDLTRAGQAVLPSSIGDSGTASRLLATKLLAGGAMTAGAGGLGYGLGGADGGEAGAGVGIGALLAASLGGSKAAQRALVASVLKRPDSVVRAGQTVQRLAPYGGMLGASVAPYLLSGQ